MAITPEILMVSQPNKELDLQEEEDANNGAILVHNLDNGMPDLGHFMEQLEDAMEKVEDPAFMRLVAERFKNKRKSKQYQRPSFHVRQPQGSIPSIKGSIRDGSIPRLSGFGSPQNRLACSQRERSMTEKENTASDLKLCMSTVESVSTKDFDPKLE